MVNDTISYIITAPIRDFLESHGFGAYSDPVIGILIITASLIAAKIIYWVIEKWLMGLATRTRTELDDKILGVLKKPVYYVVVLIGLQIALGYILVSTYAGYFESLMVIILIIVIAWTIANIVCAIIDDFGKKIAEKTESTLDDEAIPFASKMITFFIYLIAFMIILDRLEINIMPLIASLGLAGFAVGFAAKDTISNILAGFFILMDRPFIQCEKVKIGGYDGTVIDIGLRTTKIETDSKEIVIVPNSKIVSDSIVNYTSPERFYVSNKTQGESF
ncbi:MAG: hypothetical protein A7316_11085 [Candidatus Altiarchaeales archaeon WOR_SM1_86-2]|nr:MAG: hypothetical protein A7315_14185 [Candidatus Altiarchaeales archaeon WOR_SM1_79]ODS39431.1 MAG: hypothetical protein A7316_11085 [Candidatus Altiarchaeales archaeon WOR_SM1_86-2]